MKNFCQLFLALALISFFGCATQQQDLFLRAPTIMVNVQPSMQTAGFWVSRHSNPDQVILSESDIVNFNSRLLEQHLIVELTRLGKGTNGRTLRAELKDSLDGIARRKLYNVEGQPIDGKILDPIKNNMFLDGLSDSIPVHYGFAVQYADLKILPTEEAFLEAPGDVDFDQLQNSALDIGSPVAILHASRDGQWLYVQGESVPGWVRKELIAKGSLENVQRWQEANDFVVTLAAKTDIFLDEALRQYVGYAQMGTKFAVDGAALNGVVPISVPTRQDDGALSWAKGFVRERDVHRGYLVYTPRTIIEQAFKLLNAPYGWGGMYGEQDCSRFLQEIFATVGIRLPRNSGEQAKAGKVLARFDEKSSLLKKLDALQKQGVPGITLLGMKGHIMLYLGEFEGRPYAIHATWAYRERRDNVQFVHVINKVVVSDLSLGRGSAKGSLQDRLKTITIIGK